MAQKIIQLESKPFTAGGNVGVSLRSLPPRHRVRAIMLRLECLFTTGGAAGLIPGKELFRYLSNIEIQGEQGSLVKVTGEFLHFLAWIMRGGEDYLPASVPATNSSTFRRQIQVVIPFWDQEAWSPADLCPNTETFLDSTLNVDFGALAAATNGSTLASIAATLRVFAVCDDTNGQVSSLSRLGFADFATKTMVLDPGLYTHVFAYKEDTAVFTNAEVSALSIRADGAPVVSTASVEDVCSFFDYLRGEGGAVRTDSATAPIAGEQLTDEPVFTAAAATTVSPEFLPLIYPMQGYKLTHAVEATQGIQIDTTGSLSTFRIGYRRVEARNESSAVAALQKAGVPIVSAADVIAKTESKAPLSAAKSRWTRYLPLRGKV